MNVEIFLLHFDLRLVQKKTRAILSKLKTNATSSPASSRMLLFTSSSHVPNQLSNNFLFKGDRVFLQIIFRLLL